MFFKHTTNNGCHRFYSKTCKLRQNIGKRGKIAVGQHLLSLRCQLGARQAISVQVLVDQSILIPIPIQSIQTRKVLGPGQGLCSGFCHRVQHGIIDAEHIARPTFIVVLSNVLYSIVYTFDKCTIEKLFHRLILFVSSVDDIGNILVVYSGNIFAQGFGIFFSLRQRSGGIHHHRLLWHVGLDHFHPGSGIVDHVAIGTEIVNLETVFAAEHKDTGILSVDRDLNIPLSQQLCGSHIFVNGAGFSSRHQGKIILRRHIGNPEPESFGENVAIKALGFHHYLIITEHICLHLGGQIREKRIGGNRILHDIQYIRQGQLRAEHTHEGVLVGIVQFFCQRLDLTRHQHDTEGVHTGIPFHTHMGGQL